MKVRTKRCKSCGLEMDVSDFHRDRFANGGISSHCKACWHKPTDSSNPEHRIIRNAAIRVCKELAAFGTTCEESEAFQILGCSEQQLIAHLTQQMTDGMSLDNYGEWDLEHVVPTNLAISTDDMLKLLNYRNLRPWWHSDNSKKGSSLESVDGANELLGRDVTLPGNPVVFDTRSGKYIVKFRKCAACNENKKINEFEPNGRYGDGFDIVCRECKTEKEIQDAGIKRKFLEYLRSNRISD